MTRVIAFQYLLESTGDRLDAAEEELRQVARDELAWLDAHPPAECYQTAFEGWRRSMEIIAGWPPDGDEDLLAMGDMNVALTTANCDR